MSFSDVFKSSFLENINTFSTADVLMALGLSFVLGLFIFFVYKKTYQGVMYSDSFGVSLIAMSMITSLVILAVTSNVVLSLGMVGALSIVRFRTAIKEPMDIAFLFWSIAVGIVLAQHTALRIEHAHLVGRFVEDIVKDVVLTLGNHISALLATLGVEQFKEHVLIETYRLLGKHYRQLARIKSLKGIMRPVAT